MATMLVSVSGSITENECHIFSQPFCDQSGYISLNLDQLQRAENGYCIIRKICARWAVSCLWTIY